MERGAEVLALCEDGAPTQAGLEPFEAQFLEQAMVVADRKAPFGVVIVEKIRRRGGPAAAWFSIGTDDRAQDGILNSRRALAAPNISSLK